MTNKDIAEEARSLTNHMAGMPGLGHGTCTKEVLRKILLDTGGELFCGGRVQEITTKHLGAGIYKVSTKLKEPNHD